MGIWIYIDEIDADVVYSNMPHPTRQKLSCLEEHNFRLIDKNGVERFINGYKGVSRDVRTTSVTRFYAFIPRGPYYEHFAFMKKAKERINGD